MNFEVFFNREDIPQAEKQFRYVLGYLELIKKHTTEGEPGKAKVIAIDLLNTLNRLDNMAYKHRSDERMYLHYLLNRISDWYPK